MSVIVLWVTLSLDIRFGLQASMINTQPLFFPIVFVSGIIMINYLSSKLTDTRTGTALAVIGDFSFSIMALHFVGFKLVTLARRLGDSSIELSAFPVDKTDIYVWMPIYLIVGILFPIIASKAYSKVKYAWNCNCRLQKS